MTTVTSTELGEAMTTVTTTELGEDHDDALYLRHTPQAAWRPSKQGSKQAIRDSPSAAERSDGGDLK